MALRNPFRSASKPAAAKSPATLSLQPLFPASGLSLLSQPLLPPPAAPNTLRAKFGAMLAKAFPAPELTTEGGVAGSASPAVSGYTRQQQVWERRRIIPQMWALYRENPRFRAAVEIHVAKAVAGGFSAKIAPRDSGTTAASAKRAQTETNAYLRRVGLVKEDGAANTALLAKYLRHGRMEADVFRQNIVAWNEGHTAGEIVAHKIMPAITMERLTDDTDEFLDAERAFVQIDLSNQQVVPGGEFAQYQISHFRWKQLGEDRYGQFEYAPALGISHNLAVLEQFQETRRKSNAARIEEHILGEKGNNQTTQTDIDNYKKNNGVLDKAAAVDNDPYQPLARYFHDANAEIKVHPSDPSVDEIKDLIYFMEKEGAAVGTPIQLFGQNMAGMSRDTLDLVIGEWLDGMAYDLSFVYDIITDGIALQLELKGMNRDAFTITLARPKRVFENGAECIAFIKDAMSNTLGAGMNAKPFPLLTAETAVAMLAEYIGVTDAEDYVAKLEAMLADKHMDADTVHEMQMMGADPGVGNGTANSKNNDSKAGGGGGVQGKRFENGGKLKPGQTGAKGGDAYKKLP